MGTLHHVAIPIFFLFIGNYYVNVQCYTTSAIVNHFGKTIHYSSSNKPSSSSFAPSPSSFTELHSEFPKQSGSHLHVAIDIDALVDKVASIDDDVLNMSDYNDDGEDEEREEQLDEQTLIDMRMMKDAVQLAQSGYVLVTHELYNDCNVVIDYVTLVA